MERRTQEAEAESEESEEIEEEEEESETEEEEEEDSDEDSDDVPLGQRHPEALLAQAKIRAERAAAKKQQQQLARAATSAKLSMKTSKTEEDDNQPLGVIKRNKSIKQQQQQPQQQPFSIDELCKKLELVQQNQAKPTVLIPKTKPVSPSDHSKPKSPPRAHTEHITRATSLRRAKSAVDRNPPPMIPLPVLPTHHHHQQQQQQQQPRSPVTHKPTMLLNPIDTQSIDRNHHNQTQVHSPMELISPCLPPLNKKILIKVGIVNQSQSILIEIDQDTTVKELLENSKISYPSLLEDNMNKGSWGVYEIWNDLGIERPIREIEKIMNIVRDTWTSIDTNETHLLIQRSDLSGLAVSKRSFTSGVHGGNLWCELKPGKWTKKYVLLRDNSVYLCSNDKGKDEMLLCTMEKFDVYSIPDWAHKSLKNVPRDHSFGLKSLNKFSFFEHKSDFIHKFSCKDKLVQLEWIRRLYDSRSYIIMSQQGKEESTSGLLSRTKSTHHSTTKPSGGTGILEKAKSIRLKRNGTTRHQREVSQEPMPTEPNGSQQLRKGSIPPAVPVATTTTGSHLSRKPTLIQTNSLSKFKQGTLLGDLAPPALPNGPKHHQLSDENHHVHAILPSHILGLSSSSSPTVDPKYPPPRDHHEDHHSRHIPPIDTNTNTTTIKLRTWEQMGSDERKLYLVEVQNKAKLEGRTLLQFDNSLPPHSSSSKPGGPGGAISLPLVSGGSHDSSSTTTKVTPSSSGLKRSLTTGNQTRSPHLRAPLLSNESSSSTSRKKF
ncbi:hypothetical protein MJO28_011535 [Puccinia striiformis f. sp. tritici]|uniref:Uncharacterized protein n=1 Tax=Puccinia striiformis f. sp. tritici TaxID=168172 RepID=A0ACC0E303_9BASI|nr:hypothetical protein MJO28_011535 [Puccinia striiformis f. sp. tritici]